MSKYIKYSILEFQFQRIINFFKYFTRRMIKSLLQLMIVSVQSPRLAKAGFVLPTVTMVMLVVVLLTIAISLRSFDRVEQARNVRINQAVLSAATPALDRAKAKLENLLVDQAPVTGTPKDDVLYTVLTDSEYTFGDETRLDVRFDIDQSGEIEDPNDSIEIEDREFISTAWRFPVDTDNNGEFDSFTLYGIFFRNPPRQGTGFARARIPLEARTIPQQQEQAITNQECSAALGTSSGIVGDSSWFDSGEVLRKAFFVYTVNVPITNVNQSNLLSSDEEADDFENFKGTPSISALEYQQDRIRIPLTNNAVVYEDDLEITPFPAFRLNGRIITNSNLIISPYNNPMRLYQVSSKNSCFYNSENGKIIVGGNVVNGQTDNETVVNDVTVDIFNGDQQDPITATLGSANDSTTNNAREVMYDTQQYAELINTLVDDAEDKVKDEERTTLEKYFENRTRKVPWRDRGDVSGTETVSGTTLDDIKPSDEEWIFSVNDEGQVYDELVYDTQNNLPATNPEDEDIKNGKEKLIGDRILVGNNLPLEVWDGTEFKKAYEQNVEGGTWSDQTKRTRTSRVEELSDAGSLTRKNNSWNNDDMGFWEKQAVETPAAALDGIGGLRIVTGAGVYERDFSFLPPPINMTPSGTRSDTYDDPTTSDIEEYEIVWPDTMPMSLGRRPQQVYDNEKKQWRTPADVVTEITDLSDLDDWTNIFDPPTKLFTSSIDPNTQKYAKGDLRMRATAVYHYAQIPGENQTPVACISSYYDPTDYDTAQNSYNATDNTNLSNNGQVYGPPPARPTGSRTLDPITGLFTTGTDNLGRLAKQANMVFPDGRFVNELLREALQNTEAERTLAQRGAIDSTLCAFGILGTSGVALGTAPDYIPDNAIKELTFLNAREVKAMESDNTVDTPNTDEMFSLSNPLDKQTETIIGNNYDLSLEERYPLEIRVTQLDLNLLRNQVVPVDTTQAPNAPTPEYLLPNSGIIYATRDDALPDRSSRKANDANNAIDHDRSRLVSPTDYIVDPTRRPNGIMLINGERLARNDNNNDGQNDTTPKSLSDVIKEKGLILVSNLPVYIQGNFNVHTEQEFNDNLTSDWSNFYSRNGKNTNTGLNDDFACRPGDPRVPKCKTGDSWRQATVLADSITLLSDSFRAGYRNEGNFDLRNNAGDVVIDNSSMKAKEARRKNGFFTNDFVTTGLTSATRFKIDSKTTIEKPWDNDYSKPNNNFNNSSYFNNFVTPVQRRVLFPEYVMEICRKFPLSYCGPADWVVGYDANGDFEGNNDTGGDGDLGDSETTVGGDLNGDGSTSTNVYERDIYSEQVIDKKIKAIGDINKGSIFRMRLGSGTTAKPPLEPNNQSGAKDYPGDQRYARRLAFKRNHYHQLELEKNSGQYTTIPLGVNSSVAVQEYSYNYNYPATIPRQQYNALWFRTTKNTTGQPDAVGDISYANKRLPYYYFDDNGDGTPDEINGHDDTNTNAKRVLLPKTKTDYTLDNADKYAVCLNDGGASQSFEITTLDDDCSSTETTEIGNLNTTIQGYVKKATLSDVDLQSDISLPRDADTDNTGNGKNVWVYDLPNQIGSNSKIVKITLKGDANTVFIFRRSGNLTFGTGTSSTVRVELEGNVDPNNIFWVVNGNIKFEDAPKDPKNHLVTGNFLGTGTLTIGNNTQILGSRLLGFTDILDTSGSRLSDLSSLSGGRVTAMSTQDQPLLVPVLQIRAPRKPTNNTAPTDTLPDATNTNSNQGHDTGWMVPATATEFNLVVGSKDTPSRPLETNGGLQNLPRFLENWEEPERSTNILGSFVQLGRSEYATAPYLQIFRDSSNSTDKAPNSLFPDFEPFLYGSGTAGGRIAYQGPPARNWGYDIGLLSQSPDLFAVKFTMPPTNPTLDEFYREVGQDDEWIQALLCAVQTDTEGSAVNSDVRPTDCP